MTQRNRFTDYFIGCMTGLACGDTIGSLASADPKTKTADRHARLALMIAQSLADSGGLNRNDLDRRLVEEYARDTNGWSDATRIAAERIIHAREGRSSIAPLFVPHRGYGDCEVAARIAPVGLWFGLHPDKFPETAARCAFLVGQQTHPDRSASFGATAMIAAVSHVLYHGLNPSDPIDAKFFCDQVLATVRAAEKHHLGRYGTFSDALAIAFDATDDPENAAPAVSGRAAQDLALRSVPFVLAMFLRYPTDFRAAMRAITEAGGDTAAHGAMIGALIGTNLGFSGNIFASYECCDKALFDACYAAAMRLHATCLRVAFPTR